MRAPCQMRTAGPKGNRRRVGDAAPAKRTLRGASRTSMNLRGALFLGRTAFGARRQHGIGDQTGVGADRLLDLGGGLGVILEILLGVLAALADALAIIGEIRAGFLDHAGLHAEIKELAALGDA